MTYFLTNSQIYDIFLENIIILGGIFMKNNKITHIAVDFDGTLTGYPTNYPEPGKQKWIHRRIMKYLRKKQINGAIIIVNTLREGDDLYLAMKFCWDRYFHPNFFNENDPKLIEKWGESRKISADIYIDDRNFGIFGWLLRVLG